MSRPHIAILITGEELVSDTTKEIAKSHYPRSTRRKEAEAAENQAVDWEGASITHILQGEVKSAIRVRIQAKPVEDDDG